MSLKEAADIFYLGSNLEWLEYQTKIREEAKGEESIVYYLEATENFLKSYKYTHPCCLKGIRHWKKKLNKYKLGEKISVNDAVELSKAASHWKEHFTSYLVAHYFWEVNPKGFTDPHTLLKEPATFFEKRANWKKLSQTAKYDLSDAFRSLCFELPTPAAFMLWRACEDTLRRYHVKKLNTQLKGFLDWYRITRDLEASGRIPGHIIDTLDLIRNNYRNPVAHPDERYTQKQTERLLHYAIDLLESMLNDM